MSAISGYEVDGMLNEVDKVLRVLVQDGVTTWYMDGKEIFSTSWNSANDLFKWLIDEVEG